MNDTPDLTALDALLIPQLFAVLEHRQAREPDPQRAETIRLLRPLRDELAHGVRASRIAELLRDPDRKQIVDLLLRVGETSLGDPGITAFRRDSSAVAIATVLARSDTLARRDKPRRASSDKGFQRSLLVCCDLKGSGSADDLLQRELRQLLVRSLDRAGEAAGLDRSEWRRLDRGDGEWAVVPASTQERDVVDRYVRALDAELATMNRYRVPHARVRMRMAIHFGTTVEGANGYPGQDAVLVSRLLDSKPAHAALEQTDADLVVVLSDLLFTSLVAAGYTTLRPEDFRRVDVRMKPFSGHGWVWIPSGNMHDLDLDDEVSTPPRPSSTRRLTVAGSGSTVIQAGRDAYMPTQDADVIQNFDRNDQRGSYFGAVYRRDNEEQG